MRVFFISPGRTATTTLAKSFGQIKSLTSGHESNVKNRLGDRVIYPDNHVEADNRLLFFMPQLTERYGETELLVIIERNRAEIANSYRKRWWKFNLPKIFAQGILMRDVKENDDKLVDDMVDWAYEQIHYFSKDWKNVITIKFDEIPKNLDQIFDFLKLSQNECLQVKEFFEQKIENKNENGISRIVHVLLFNLRNTIWDIKSLLR